MRSQILNTVDIPLTQGLVARIDIQDAPLISSYKWHAVKCSGKFYARRQEGGKCIYMHRQIMGLSAGIKFVVDHINGDTLNNTRANIRRVTQSGNLQNTHKTRGKKSIYRGVYPSGDMWVARINNNDKKLYLGSYISEKEAAAAYDGAAIALYGIGAYLNSGDNHE